MMAKYESFTPNDIERAIRSLSWIDHGDQYDRWFGLRYIERFGIDWSLYYDYIVEALVTLDCPWEGDPDFDLVAERRLALELRDIHRAELGLPLLTAQERREWRFERVNIDEYLDERERKVDFDLQKLDEENAAHFDKLEAYLASVLPEIRDYFHSYGKFYDENRAPNGWYQNYKFKNEEGWQRGHHDVRYLWDILDNVVNRIFPYLESGQKYQIQGEYESRYTAWDGDLRS